MMSKFIHTYTICLAILSLIASPVALAQQEDTTRPGPLFLSAFKTVTEAEKLEEQKHYKQSWEKYHQALRYYKTLSNAHPDWKPHLVNGRIETTGEAIKRITPMAEKEYSLQRDRLAHLVEGGANTDDQSTPDPSGKVFTPSEKRNLADVNVNIRANERQLEAIRLRHAEEKHKLNGEINRLKTELQQIMSGNAKDSTQVRMLNGDIARLQQELRKVKNSDKATQQKYLQALDELQRQRERLASAPLRKDVEKLREETGRQRRELEVLSRDYKKKVAELQRLRKEKAADETQYALLEDKLKRTQKQLDTSQKNANTVVASLREENKALLREVTEQRQKIAAQQAQINDLTLRLEKSDAIADELRRDLASMTKERDQLSELLELSDVDRGKELMKENLRLARELTKAQQSIKTLHRDKNTAQDRVIEAENNVAIAKKQILDLKEEKISYMKRITQLENTLKSTREELSQKLTQPNLDEASREEAEILRSTVQRLMAAQNRRREVEKALFEEYRKLAKQDEGMENLFKSLADNNITLTDKERQYLSEQESTDTFVNPVKKYADAATRNIAEQKIEEKKSTYHSMAKRFIEKGKLDVAMDIYDEAYDTTYDFNFLVNRGVIRLRIGDESGGDEELYKEAARIFETGVTTRPSSPYTHFMLGMARFRMDEDALANKSLAKAIDLKPDYPLAYLFLGVIAAQNSEFNKAEENFDNAIRLNPEFHDAHFNMSVLHLMKGDLKKARRHYNDALRSGHPINLEHERKIGIKKAG